MTVGGRGPTGVQGEEAERRGAGEGSAQWTPVWGTGSVWGEAQGLLAGCCERSLWSPDSDHTVHRPSSVTAGELY